MKKLVAKIIAVALSLVCLFSFASCAEVENGSKIERIKIHVSLVNAAGEPVDYDIYAKMYLNFADFTIEHVKGLIEQGYYNNVDVSTLTSSYFSFGDRKVDLTKADPLAERIDTNVKYISGQFLKNGYTGNKLSLSAGAILLNRSNEPTTIDGVVTSKYNTGKATLTVAFSSAAPFNPQEYCVFGQIISDDGNSEADSSSDEYLSSLEKALKIKEYISTTDGVRIYRLEKDILSEDEVDENGDKKVLWKAGSCFTYAKNTDGEYTYFEGIYLDTTPDLNSELKDEDLKTVKSKLSSNGYSVTIPVVSIKVSVTLEKQGCAGANAR